MSSPEPPATLAAIALGSNLGDCRATLEGALAALDATPGLRVLRRSSWYRSAPVGPPQPDYLNAALIGGRKPRFVQADIFPWLRDAGNNGERFRLPTASSLSLPARTWPRPMPGSK